MLIQQGDVLLRKIDMVPSNVKKVGRKPRGYVLAEGEVTGHAHVIVDEDIELLIDNTEKMFLKNDKEVELKHEEHNNIQIPEGVWEIGIVQEYDHFAEEAKKVVD